MTKEEFKQCPMYKKSKNSGKKLIMLEKGMVSMNLTLTELREDVDKLITDHGRTIANQSTMKQDIQEIKETSIAQYEKANKVYKGLEAHMKEEAAHNKKTIEDISSMSSAVHGLIKDNTVYRKHRLQDEERSKVEEALRRQEKEQKAALASIEHDKQAFRRSIYSKVIGSVATVVVLTMMGFMWEAFGYFQTAKEHVNIAKEQLINQRQYMIDNRIQDRYNNTRVIKAK